MKIIYYLLAALLIPTLLFILPNQIGSYLLLFFIKFHSLFFYFLIGAIVIGITYWLFNAKDRSQLKNRFYLVLAIPIIGYGFICIFSYLVPTEYENCDQYTKDLNGGAQEFQGKKYNIKLCGTSTFNHSDEIRMQILDEKGELVVLRYFTIRINSAGPKELDYSHDTIFYNDYSRNEPLSTLTMPPSQWEAIRARLPFF